MDEVDGEILRLLRDDARISWRDLGAAVGLSANAAADRVRRLRQSGVITGFVALIDPAAGGRNVEARGGGRELVRVRALGERDADERLQRPPAGGGVDERHEAGDHARGAQPANALGGRVGAQADGGAEVAPRDASVVTEKLEDLAVHIIHDRDCLSSWT